MLQRLHSKLRPATRGIWWLHPAALFAVAGCGVGIAAYLLPESTYRTLWRTPKFFDAPALEVTFACVAVFVFGALLSSKYLSRFAPPFLENRGPAMHWDLVAKLFRVSVWLAVVGYALWIGLAIQRGMTWSSAVGVIIGEKGAMYDARFTYLPTVGGVTTLTEFGSAAAILGAILGCNVGWKPVRWRLGLILGLAILRAVLNSERFAIIELVVPFLIAAIPAWYLSSKPVSNRIRLLVKFAPVIGTVVLLIVFTGFEYFRSWSNYYAGRDQSLLEFGAMRLLGYYVTSFNNGAYFLSRLDALNAPYFTLHFLWGFPLSSPIIKRLFADPILDSTEKWFYFPFLESDANIEFNNADGMMFPLMDYGVAGGLLYWFAVGLACGLLYYLYCHKTPLGLMLYPIVYLGLLEVPLALYWGEGRAFPSQLLLCIAPIVLWFGRRNKDRPMLVPAPVWGGTS
jgi:hypothetical protein